MFVKTGFSSLVCLFSISTFVLAESPEPEEVDAFLEQARWVHTDVLTLDTHIDIPFDFATAAVDPGIDSGWQVTLPKMRSGGLDVGFFIVFVPQTERTQANIDQAKSQAMTKFAAIHRMAEEMYPDQIEIAYSVSDVERIHKAGKLVAMIGIENGYAIGRDLQLIQTYAELGARYMTLAHGGHNDLADSATPVLSMDKGIEHQGLSEFGKAAIKEMNRVGMLVDVSHISRDAMMQATQYSSAPVIASHSSIRALNNHPRNLDDEQLLAIKAKQGVVQIVAFDSYLKHEPVERVVAISALRTKYKVIGPGGLRYLEPDVRKAFDAELAEIYQKWPQATVSDFVDHIDYAVALIGIDHVGIASDFQGGGGVVGWNNAAETQNVTAELLRRGYSQAHIEKLWSANFLRVLSMAEDEAIKRARDDGSSK